MGTEIQPNSTQNVNIGAHAGKAAGAHKNEKKPHEAHTHTEDHVHVPHESYHKNIEDKEVTQHFGNFGFGNATALGVFKTATELTGKASGTYAKAARIVPGLNLAVAGVESYNTVRQVYLGHNTAAAGHAGNALGCLGAFFEEVGAGAKAAGLLAKAGKFTALATGLGIAGGAVGLVGGISEIRMGHAMKNKTGHLRLLGMGVLDITSGVLSLTGSALAMTGVGGPLGIGLIALSGLCDITCIGVDYLGNKFDHKLKSKKHAKH